MIPNTSDMTQNYHGGNIHSLEAHASIENCATKLREQVLQFIADQGEHGATCNEAENALNLRHQTASARFTELKAAGKIVEIGRRKTDSGRYAGVMVVVG